ncbi:hypothetical protein T01_15362 [Trichinella spiralis]|uniref:Uncharacterized protein n=1 Tax=Trichinella spiralis TaxID=6334 RepID=A0A0V1B3D1_TRISP|nr:hypothetical protein T01_15362 [Trichinella spiralis]
MHMRLPCLFLRFSKVGFFPKFRSFCYKLLNSEKLIGFGKFHGKQTRWLNFGVEFFFDMIMRYSLKFASLVQYFFVLGNSIFLHFRSVSNKLIKDENKTYYQFITK